MAVLEEFYQIAERETKSISLIWKALHIFTFVILTLCGFTTAFYFGNVLDDFNYNCILKSDVVFDKENFINVSSVKQAHAIDLTFTVWGPNSECNFAQFTALFSMLSAIIWGLFFIITTKGGAGYSSDSLSRPWTILYPCLFFTIIFFIISIISKVRLADGIFNFCKSFQTELNNTVCTKEIDAYLVQFLEEKTDSKYLDFGFYNHQQIAVLAAEIGIWAWFIQLFLLISRVCSIVDFDLYLVTILSKEEEKIESVIDFQDEDEKQMFATSKV